MLPFKAAGTNKLHAGSIKSLPNFRIWQAHSLVGRDLLFAIFLLITFCLYIYKTVPAACSIGPDIQHNPCGACSIRSDVAEQYGRAHTSTGSTADCHDAADGGCCKRSSMSVDNNIAKECTHWWPLPWKLFCMQPLKLTSDRLAWVQPTATAQLQSEYSFPGPLVQHQQLQQSRMHHGGVTRSDVLDNDAMLHNGVAANLESESSAQLLQDARHHSLVSPIEQLQQLQKTSGTARATLGLRLLQLLSKLAGVVILCAQALFRFFAVGWFIWDPFHMLIPPLRLLFVLMLATPLPCPNFKLLHRKAAQGPASAQPLADSTSSSDSAECSRSSRGKDVCSNGSSRRAGQLLTWYQPSWYCDCPSLRHSVILMQRLLPPLCAAASVGCIDPRFFDLAALKYWPVMGQYMYLGWTAFMLVLPSELHIATSLLEWLLIFTTAVRVNSTYYNIPAISSTSVYHCLVSLLFVVVLPTAGVLWIEQGQKAKYAALQKLVQTDEQHAAIEATEHEQHNRHAQSSQAAARFPADRGCSRAGLKLRHSSLVRKHSSSGDARVGSVVCTTVTAADTGSSPCTAAPVVQSTGMDECPVTSLYDSISASDHHSSREAKGSSSSRCNDDCSSTASQCTICSTTPGSNASGSLEQSRCSSSSIGTTAQDSSSTVGPQLLADITSSLQLAVTAAAEQLVPHQPLGCLVNPTAEPTAASPAAPAGACTSRTALQRSQSLPTSSGASFVACLENQLRTHADESNEDQPLHQSNSLCYFEAAHATHNSSSRAFDSATCSNVYSSSSAAGVASLLPDMMDALAGMLGVEAAAVVMAGAAAAAAAGPGPRPGDMPFYTSMACALPVSMKVHTSHSEVGLLAPVLSDTLAHQVSPTSHGDVPMQLQSACFAGCVQLLANIITLTHADAEASTSSSGRGVGFSPGSLAADLLSNVLLNMQSAASTAAAAAGAPVMGPASTHADVHITPAVNCFQGGEALLGLPAIAVTVGNASITSSSGSTTTTPAAAAAPQLTLQCCNPACIVADKQQQLVLYVQNGKPAGQSSSTDGGLAAAVQQCRLLVLRNATVLLDQDVTLTDRVSVPLPAQPAGVCRVALLPRATSDRTAPTATLASAAPRIQAQAQSAAPLLLQPLLVLPEAAASEMHNMWQAAAAAASGSSISTAAAWQQTVGALTVDIAYVLLACSTAAAASQSCSAAVATQQRRLPAGVTAVLKNLLQHLAATGMFHTMKFLTEAAVAAVTVSAGAPPENEASTKPAVVYHDCCAGFCSNSSNEFEGPLAEHSLPFQPPIKSISLDSAYDAAQHASQASAAAGGTSGAVSAIRMDSASVAPCGSCHGCSSATCAKVPANGEDDNASETCCEADASLQSVLCPGSLHELLFGFADCQRESQFLAAAFGSSAMFDCMTVCYNVFMGVGCWFVGGDKMQVAGVHSTTDSSSSNNSASALKLFISIAVVFLFNAAMPIAVLLLRLATNRSLTQAWQQKQKHNKQAESGWQQDREQVQGSPCNSAGSSSRSSKRSAATTVTAKAEAPDSTTALARAACIKHKLNAVWIILVVMLNISCATDVIVPPVMVGYLWGSRNTMLEVIWLIGLGMKAWMYQVPFAWFVPLITLEVASHMYASVMYQLQQAAWIWLRYPSALLLAVAVAAWSNMQSRKQFCSSHAQGVKSKLE